MATQTTNYGLKKPDYNDNADIGVINDNMDIIDTELKNIEETLTYDISQLKGYPYLQNTTISDYLDNNFPQGYEKPYNIRFAAFSSDNVGDLPTSSAYHISATRNQGAGPWCLEATEIVADGFKKFIGYKDYGADIVWQEVARKSDLTQIIVKKSVRIGDVTIENGGYLDIKAYKPSISNYTFFYATIGTWVNSDKLVGFTINGRGEFLIGTAGQTIFGLVIDYYFIKDGMFEAL